MPSHLGRNENTQVKNKNKRTPVGQHNRIKTLKYYVSYFAIVLLLYGTLKQYFTWGFKEEIVVDCWNKD